MRDISSFEMKDFLPYLLNQAAEESSLAFQKIYRDRYGMLRNEWRVLFHLGRYGDMTSTDVAQRAKLHKTKVSRAVSHLQEKRYLVRQEVPKDRRQEMLRLTPAGQEVYRHLSVVAEKYSAELWKDVSAGDLERFTEFLVKLAKLDV